MAHGRESDLRKAYRAVSATVAVVVVVAVAVIGVRASYGYFNDDMVVSGVFPRASQALRKGSDVKYLGVSVGKVKSIEPDGLRVRIQLALHHGAKVPEGVRAVIEPNTFFGDKFVDLQPDGSRGAPWLGDGDKLAHTSSGYEVEQVIGSADRLVAGINGHDLQTLISELTQFSKGEGTKISHNIRIGVQAASVFDRTLEAQLNALDALQRFTHAIRDDGPLLNGISNDLNVALPVFNDARAKFETALRTLKPFADLLASFLSVNRPDFDRILVDGEDLLRVVLAQRKDISDTIYGLSRYFYKFSVASGPDRLPDGTRMAFFKAFIDLSQITQMLCPALSSNPAVAQLVKQASSLAGGAPLIDCTSTAPPGTNVPGAGATASPSTNAAAPALPNQPLGQTVNGVMAQPNPGQRLGLGAVLARALGGSG